MTREEAVQQLREVLTKIRPDSPERRYRVWAASRDAKESVFQRFRPVFAAESLDKLTVENVKSFLAPSNNKHWGGMHFLGGVMTKDMGKLKAALRLLADESQPISTRLDKIRPPGREPMVKNLNRAVITAILLVLYPARYGMWNNVVEAGMVKLGLWPEMPPDASFGDRYERMNAVLRDVALALGVDLWTLDLLWWGIVQEDAGTNRPEDMEAAEQPEAEQQTAGAAAFGLEKHLHDFLVDNWDQTMLGRDWILLEEDGETVGSHYQTGEVGEIDILAKHRSQNRWLVVELKRNQSSDETVGQVLRYMGWVRHRKAEKRAPVEGLIVCREVDAKLQFALDGQRDIRCMTYQVSFALSNAPGLE